MKLPSMPYGNSLRTETQTAFTGYDHNPGAGDGAIYDMQNLTGRYYPLLATRPKRALVRTIADPNGLFGYDGLCWVDGTGFYYNGTSKGTVADSKKQFAALGTKLLIFPDKKYYDSSDDTFGSLEATYVSAVGGVTFADGTLYGEDAEGNTLTCAAADFNLLFKAGDAVTISGCTSYPANNKTPIIREISDDGHSLRFSENALAVGTEAAAVTIARTVPNLDFLCVNENRAWGCKGDTIYCSKLGDPFNWNVFDGVATDAWACAVGSAGDFTGCISYLGYPVFFKEDMVYKVYGSLPSNYQVIPSARLGVLSGCADSLAVAGETLFYLSRAGIVAYTGGVPSSIAEAFGDVRYTDAVAGSDGLRYYVSMKTGTSWSLFVYDVRRGMWHREDATQALCFVYYEGALYLLASDGKLWMVSGDAPAGSTAEGSVSWEAEFSDFTDGSPDKKGVERLQIRCELGALATMTVMLKYDSGATWETVRTLTAGTKKSCVLPVIPRRADHYRLKLSGTGECKVYGITRVRYQGSER